MWLLACVSPPEDSPAPDSPAAEETAAAPDTGPWGEARDDVANCRVRTWYDDDADGATDRWTDVVFDADEQWTTEGFDDGTYVGTLTATWDGVCLARIDGSFVDDDNDQWTLTINQTCDAAGNVTRRVEVWDQDFEGGGGSVYGHTIDGEYGYDDAGRLTSARLSDDDWESADAQTWTYSALPWADSSDVDWFEDGVVDAHYDWTWDADGDVITEALDGAVTTYVRDGRDRLVTIEGAVTTTYVYPGPDADRPLRAFSPESVTTWSYRCD